MWYRSRLVVVAVIICLTAFSSTVSAKSKKPKKAEESVKELSGISIVGNKEAPKSLFIVPWKSSEIAVETGLTSKLLNENLDPVDIDVFERELDFYTATTAK